MLNDWGFHHLHLDEIDPARGTAQMLIRARLHSLRCVRPFAFAEV